MSEGITIQSGASQLRSKETYIACHESTPCQNTSVVLSDVALHLKGLVKLICLVSTLCLKAFIVPSGVALCL